MQTFLEIVLCVLAVFIANVGAIPVDNGVEGDPEIECGVDSLTVNFNTQNTFEGFVFSKGMFANEACRRTASGQSKVASISLMFNECNSHKRRSLNPRGVFITTTVVIQFHPQFITKVDRVYRVQCYFMETEKTVDTDIEVSMLTTVFQTQQVPMPICRYDILSAETREPISFATVGMQVYHSWICDSETIDTFCMVVHSCYVDGNEDTQVDLIGPDGCAEDIYLLNSPEYITDLSAGVEAHVFKFADKADLYFQCQISIFVKEPEQTCPRPSCPTPPGRGAGEANPQRGSIPSAPEHPFPLQSGSPYLPVGALGGRQLFARRRTRFLRSADQPELQSLEAGVLDVDAVINTLDISQQCICITVRTRSCPSEPWEADSCSRAQKNQVPTICRPA